MDTRARPSLSRTSTPIARVDDLRAGTSLVFESAREHLIARTSDEVLPVLRAAQAASTAGAWVVGMIAYEAAAGVNPDANVHDGVPGLPLVHLMLCDAPIPDPVPLIRQDLGTWDVGTWRADWTPAQHADRVARVHAAIAAGETYQLNLTTQLRTRIDGDLRAAYRALALRQRGSFCAHLDLGRWQVLSASPECFVRYGDGLITAVPMKGTAARGTDPASDAAAREALRASPKDRAENIMITDLLRNDLSIIAETGTVHVPELLAAEEYPTLFQLTSTVRARLREDVGLPEILQALFPCGSITGAPKLSSMALLRDLEDAPRGVYCGAIGFLPPGGTAGSFSVAIRTILVDTATGAASYGVGGGVTWASTADGEFEELRAKARVLRALGPGAPARGEAVGFGDPGEGEPDRREATGSGATSSGAPDHGETVGLHARDPGRLGLLETLAVDDGEPRHLDQHVERLRVSARELGIPVAPQAVAAAIRAEARTAVTRRAEPWPGPAACTTARAETSTPFAANDGTPQATAADGRASLDTSADDMTSHDTSAPAPVEGRLVRACLHPDGRLEVTSRPAGTPPVPVRLVIDDVRRDPEAVTVRRKTTDRRHYEQARSRHPAADDVVLLGRSGLVTETTIANVAVLLDGTWWTPPTRDGCLPGVGRAVALASGRLRERSITVAELRAAEAVAVVSSARGWREAVIVDDPAQQAPSEGVVEPETAAAAQDEEPSRRASSTARSTRSASSGPSTR